MVGFDAQDGDKLAVRGRTPVPVVCSTKIAPEDVAGRIVCQRIQVDSLGFSDFVGSAVPHNHRTPWKVCDVDLLAFRNVRKLNLDSGRKLKDIGRRGKAAKQAPSCPTHSDQANTGGSGDKEASA